jgi:ribosomal protein S14
MLHTNLSNRSIRRKFSKKEIFFTIGNLIKQSNSISKNIDYFFFCRRFSFVFYCKIQNYCLLTGQANAVHSKFKLSRWVLTNKINNGLYTGIYSAVW